MVEKVEKGIGTNEVSIPKNFPKSFPSGTTAEIKNGGVTLTIPDTKPKK